MNDIIQIKKKMKYQKVLIIIHMMLLFVFFFSALSLFNRSNYKKFQRDKLLPKTKGFNEPTVKQRKYESMSKEIEDQQQKGIVYLLISLIIVMSAIYHVQKFPYKKNRQLIKDSEQK